METPTTPPEPQAPAMLCPFCRKQLTEVGWSVNQEVGLVSIFHNKPDCMTVVGCHLIPIQQPLIEMPGGRGNPGRRI